MPPDLVVDAVTVSSPVIAPCPTVVVITLRNDGTDPAPFPIDVCLGTAQSPEDEFAPEHIHWITGTEGSVLAPGQSITDGLQMALPCQPATWLTAVADCLHRVPNNKHTNPARSVYVTPITTVPWLLAILRIGVQEPGGVISWDPAALCPNRPLVVEAGVVNEGGATAPPSVTELELRDPQGQQVGGAQWQTPSLGPGASATFQHIGSLPSPAPSHIAVALRADAGNAVSGQCDLSGVSRSMTLPVSGVTGGPALSLSVESPVLPGQIPKVSWSLKNGCADLGTVTAEVRFSGTALLQASPIAVGAFGAAGQSSQPLTIPAAVQTAVWTLGKHQLDLVVTGTGADKGPFSVAAQLEVVPEFIEGWWWAWPAFTRTADWGAVYLLSGRFRNFANFASMTPSSITINEHPAGVSGTAQDVSITVSGPFPSLEFVDHTQEPPMFSDHTSQNLLQDWEWTAAPTYDLTGPTDRSFDYTASVPLVDQFGNAYPGQSSGPLTVTVSVPLAKVSLQSMAHDEFVLAVVFLASFSYAPIGWIILSQSIWHGAQALDPPAPDFRYDEAVEVAPVQPFVLPDQAPPWVSAMAPVIELLERGRTAHQAMVSIHAKLLGAYADAAEGPLRTLADAYQRAEGLLSRSVELLQEAGGAASRALDQDPAFKEDAVAAALERWRSEGMPEALRESWFRAGLPEEELTELDRAVQTRTLVAETPQVLMNRLTATAARFAEAVHAEVPTIIPPQQGGEGS